MVTTYRLVMTLFRIFAKIQPGTVAAGGERLAEMAGNPKPRQVPLRLPEELIRVLEVARLASGAKSMQAFLSEVVSQAAKRYANEPEIKAALRSIEEYQARSDGKLKRLAGGTKEDSATVVGME
jgi:hypothetical protein